MARTRPTASKPKKVSRPKKGEKQDSKHQPEPEPDLKSEEKEKQVKPSTAPIFEKGQIFVIPDDENPNETFKLIKVTIVT